MCFAGGEFITGAIGRRRFWFERREGLREDSESDESFGLGFTAFLGIRYSCLGISKIMMQGGRALARVLQGESQYGSKFAMVVSSFADDSVL